MNALTNKYTKDVRDKQERFLQCLLPIQNDIERFALFLTKNREDAKELVAETIARCFEHFDSVKHLQAFKSYAMTITRRLYQEQKKSKYRLHTHLELDELFSDTISQESIMETKLLYEAIGKLPDEQQEAIILAEIMGYPHKEIAAIQNSNQAAVKVRIYRAKKALAALLSDKEKQKRYHHVVSLTGSEHS